MDVISNLDLMTKWSQARRDAGQSIAFVPTMGCLHAGHLSLVREACRQADLVVVSIFVNPAQFGPDEDFECYPRTFDDDLRLLREIGVDVLFVPKARDIYPDGFQTNVRIGGVSQGLCGASRPGHFDGVATIVAKLFNLVAPHKALFGEKDFQQLAVIRAMVRDLNFNLDIVGHPIVREDDGLAMSSRNRYLNGEERKSALCLYNALQNTRRQVENGEKNCRNLLNSLQTEMAMDSLVNVDYLQIVNDLTLRECKMVDESAVLLMAVKIGRTRLIDNGYLVQ